MKKLVLITVLLLNTLLSAQEATQNIKGVVIDKQSEYPLPQAEVVVTVAGQDYWSTTNFDGEYLIENVPTGKISIKAYYTGFAPQSFYNLNLLIAKELVVDFALLEKLEAIDEVVVVSKRRQEQVAFVTTSSAGFNVEQVGQYAGSLNDVSRMAMNYAGVSGNDDSRNDIIVRGNNPSSLLWMIEGASVPSPNHYSTTGSSGGPVSMLNINTLSQSNFLSGAFPANFGNTTSAAFDLEFKKPNKDKTEFVGQIGFGGAELGVEGPFKKGKKASYLVNYRYSTLDLFDKIGFDIGTGSAVPKYQDINTVVNIPTAKLGTFKVWAIGGLSSIEFKNDSDDDSNNYFDQKNSILGQENENLISGLSHKIFLSKKTNIKTAVSFSSIHQTIKLDTLNTTDNTYYRSFKEKVFTNQFTIDSRINTKINAKNTMSGGVAITNYGLDFYMINVGTYESSIVKNTKLSSVYSSYQHRFNDKLVLNAGLRYQYFSLNNQGALEPRIGLKYELEKVNLSFAYGLHSSMNSMLSYFTMQEVAPMQYEYRNLDLGFAKSHHFVFGLSTKLFQKLNLKTELYYQSLFEVPISHDDETYSIINSGYATAGGAQLFFDELYNEGKGKNYGLDVTLEYPLKNGFYTLLTGSVYSSKYLAKDNIWRNTAWNGDFMSSLLVGKEYSINDKSSFGADINLNYSGGKRYTPIDRDASALAGEAVYITEKSFENKLENYFRTDLKLSYKRSGKKINQEWSVDLRNVFNRKNIFSLNYNTETNQIEKAYQTGFLPVAQYRILF